MLVFDLSSLLATLLSKVLYLAMKNSITILIICAFGLLIAGCEKTTVFHTEQEHFSRDARLSVPLQEIPQETTIWNLYQEINETHDKPLDTLIISSDYLSSSLTAYVQQAINELKVKNYTINQEKTKKATLKTTNWSHPTILKQYTITQDKHTIYIAQYFIAYNQKVMLFSYASTEPSHKKSFIRSLSKIQFTF